MNINKESVDQYLKSLQDAICTGLSDLDGENFVEDKWSYPSGGGGRSRVLANGRLIEKGGVNFSYVKGDALPPAATAKRPELAGKGFEAMGVSLVIHPHNPMAPTSHMNVRFFIADAEGDNPVWWFGGGFDLTPSYGFDDDARHWHQAARDACAPFDQAFGRDVYAAYKKWCDEYFYLPHRDETRGVGGLFFDDVNQPDFETAFAFIRSVGDQYLNAYLPVLERRAKQPFTEEQRAWQLLRRGRYVEFNLVYDRGTLFGLQSGGRTESILMSLPPQVAWEYQNTPVLGSEEARLLSDYLRPRDWLGETSQMPDVNAQRTPPKMLWAYRTLMWVLSPLAIVGLCIRGFRNSAYWYRWPERFGFVPADIVKQGPFELWLHAVSVGEARAAAPLVRRLRDEHPDLKILVTTTTPTGSAMVKLMLGDSVAHCYFPYDLNGAMRRFANAVRPRLGLVMETEIWPEMIRAMKSVGTHLMYTNVRLSDRSYKNYARFDELISYTLEPVDFFAAQGQADSQHLQWLGVEASKIAVTGSIKFDVQIPASMHEMAEVTRRQLGSDRLVWIAGSTRDGEEGRILEAYKTLKQEFPHLLLVLVPRHPERFDYVARKIGRRGLKQTRRTEGVVELDASIDVYLGDTMGELSLLYASSDVAFVGGSLEPFGGQNILEPCALGVPVLFGPHMFNFPDISKWTIHEGAGIMVANSTELTAELRDLLGNASRRDRMGQRGLRFIDAHRGALQKNIDLLEPVLKRLEQNSKT